MEWVLWSFDITVNLDFVSLVKILEFIEFAVKIRKIKKVWHFGSVEW